MFKREFNGLLAVDLAESAMLREIDEKLAALAASQSGAPYRVCAAPHAGRSIAAAVIWPFSVTGNKINAS